MSNHSRIAAQMSVAILALALITIACGSPLAPTNTPTAVPTQTAIIIVVTATPELGIPAPTSSATITRLPVTEPRSATPAPSSPPTQASSCSPTDQDQYVYHPDRLQVLAACIRVSGVVVAIRNETDGDLHILLNLDIPYVDLLTAANANELGALVIEPVCVKTPSQADAIDICKSDPDPFSGPFPTVGQRVWMEGRYVLDNDHGGWAELHPLYRWGPLGNAPANTSAPVATRAIQATQTTQPIQAPSATQPAQPTATSIPPPASTIAATSGIPSGTRLGAVCRDGSTSGATGSGACSHHGGVDHWILQP